MLVLEGSVGRSEGKSERGKQKCQTAVSTVAFGTRACAVTLSLRGCFQHANARGICFLAARCVVPARDRWCLAESLSNRKTTSLLRATAHLPVGTGAYNVTIPYCPVLCR